MKLPSLERGVVAGQELTPGRGMQRDRWWGRAGACRALVIWGGWGLCPPSGFCTQGPVGIWAPRGLGEAGGRARGPARPCARLESKLAVPLESPSY